VIAVRRRVDIRYQPVSASLKAHRIPEAWSRVRGIAMRLKGHVNMFEAALTGAARVARISWDDGRNRRSPKRRRRFLSLKTTVHTAKIFEGFANPVGGNIEFPRPRPPPPWGSARYDRRHLQMELAQRFAPVFHGEGE